MLDPPFLELAYYTGRANLEKALRSLVQDIPKDAVPKKLSIPGAVGIISKSEEIESYHNTVLVLRTEGEMFCGPFRQNRRRLKKLGRQIYERFVSVADEIPCLYGAILVEYSLEEPHELLRDPRSLAFQNFFLKREGFPDDAIEEAIYQAGVEAYVMPTKTGVYVSLSAEFNPEGKDVASVEAQERSVRIGSVIARNLPL